jgi:hypothetical protein
MHRSFASLKMTIHVAGICRTRHYSNRQRVAELSDLFSSNPNTTRGRTAKIGSFNESMSASNPDMSNLYFRSVRLRNSRRRATSGVSFAMPSTITASLASSVQTTQCRFFSKLRDFRDCLPVLNKNVPFRHSPQTTIVCGLPSLVTVLIQ